MEGLYSCLEVIPGEDDVRTITSGPEIFLRRAVGRSLEAVIETVDEGKELAWFPAELRDLATHPTGRMGAGAVETYVALIRLEGDPRP